MNPNQKNYPIDGVLNGLVIASVIVCSALSILPLHIRDAGAARVASEAGPRTINPSIKPALAGDKSVIVAAPFELPTIVVVGHRNHNVFPLARSAAPQHAG